MDAAFGWGLFIQKEEEYLDGVTITPLEFYEKLVETDELPKTSQITPYRYEQEFRKAVEQGDQVICFCLSSGVSGSFQSACAAAQIYAGYEDRLQTAYVGSTIGTYSGPGAIAVAFFAKGE